jgi:hypothetical protein
MGAAGIELPEFVTPRVIERTYRRALELQNHRDSPYSRGMLLKGMNMARAQHAVMAKFLEKGADHLQKVNDSQQERFDEKGLRRTEFSEYASWREAFLRMTEPTQHEDVMFRVFGWIYAAVAEALSA